MHDVAAKLLASQKQVKNLKRAIIAGAAAIVLGSALVLGLVYAANEASKEVKTSDRQLKDTDGNDIITATAKYAITVGDFNPVEDIQFMDDMVATDANGVEYSLRIDGWAIDWDNTGVMTVFLAHGFKVTIHPGALNADGTTAAPASMALVMPDGATNTYFQFDDVLEDLVPAPEQDGGARLLELTDADCEDRCRRTFGATGSTFRIPSDISQWPGANSRPPSANSPPGANLQHFRLAGRLICRCGISSVMKEHFGISDRPPVTLTRLDGRGGGPPSGQQRSSGPQGQRGQQFRGRFGNF